MAETYTSNLELVKPDYDSPADIFVINSNMDKIDNAVANAGKVKSVNGKTGEVDLTASDVGALPAGSTAKNSEKLGGKAPEYYLQTRNLLYNSDFRNPVGQAGLGDGVYHGNTLYPADRWREWSADTTHQFDASTGLTTSGNCTLAQVVQIPLERNYTIAIGFSDGSVLCANGVFSESSGISIGNDNASIRLYIIGGVTYFSIEFCKNAIWAALYEGSYTADTLPPYVPKGYAAELAECRQYYRTGTYKIARPFTSGNLIYLCEVSYEIPMRANPNVSIKNIKYWISQSDAGISATKNIGDRFGFNSINLLSSASDNIIQFDYESTADL